MTTLRKRRSSIWTLFDAIDKQQGRCRLCRKTYKTSGNTTNMKEHLRRKHLRHYLEIFPGSPSPEMMVKSEKSVKLQKSPLSRKEMPPFDTRILESLVSEVEPFAHQDSTNFDYVRSPYVHHEREDENNASMFKPSWKIVNTDTDELRRALNYFIVHDCLPFDTVEGEGFKYFASVWQPHFKIPSRRTFLRNIESLAQNLSDLILEELGFVEHMTLTADIWTETVPVNRPVKNFISLTAHYLYNYKRTSRVIGVREMALGYTKESFETVLDDILGRWNIPKGNVVAFMTDDDEVLVEAVRSYFGPQIHLYSFSHMLNVAVMKAFNDSQQFSELVQQIKEIISFCRENPVIMEKLTTEQMKNGCSSSEAVVLVQDSSSRWTSTVLMLERFTLLYKHIACLAVDVEGFPVVINNRELEALKECLLLIQPLEEVMKEITSEKQIPISKIIPLVRCLEKSLELIHVTSELADDLKSRIVEHIKKQFGDIETSRLHSCSTILDPRFKTIYMITATGTAQALVNIIEELSHPDLQDGGKTDEIKLDILPDQKQTTLWDYHESLMMNKDGNVPVSICVSGGDQSNVPLSLQQYLSCGVIRRSDDPLQYWQRYSFVYADIAKLALKFFSILGTVAPSESFPAYMSKLVTKSKNRLHPQQLETMIMLNFLSLADWEKIHSAE